MSVHELAFPRPVKARFSVGRLIFLVLASLLVLFLSLPLVALVVRALPLGLDAWLAPATLDALQLSLITASLATLIAFGVGTPVAFLLARENFRGKKIVDTLIDLPMVLPPAVAGLALLMAFGRRGLLGATLSFFGIELPFTTAAVILAETFVAAPFYVRSAKAGFGAVDRKLEQMSELLGVSSFRTFLRVTLPLAAPLLFGGLLMTWARALGEFGATIMFAGNFPGRTQTMPLAIYSGLETNLDSALALAVFLVIVSFGILFAVRAVSPKGITLG
ncbi:MAG: molybdate ABC transporter permease subunit [Chloroflexota bacterium]|nr:MAG: molybdate ABC transporter permease subunit [Chloroflexota bacterium]